MTDIAKLIATIKESQENLKKSCMMKGEEDAPPAPPAEDPGMPAEAPVAPPAPPAEDPGMPAEAPAEPPAEDPGMQDDVMAIVEAAKGMDKAQLAQLIPMLQEIVETPEASEMAKSLKIQQEQIAALSAKIEQLTSQQPAQTQVVVEPSNSSSQTMSKSQVETGASEDEYKPMKKSALIAAVQGSDKRYPHRILNAIDDIPVDSNGKDDKFYMQQLYKIAEDEGHPLPERK